MFLDDDVPTHCTALLNHGQWLDNKFQNWQPPGCMLHKYEANDIASCLQSQKVLFVGDSTVRQVFWAAARKLARHDADKHKERAQKHSSYSYTRRNVTLEFWWDPFLNSTALKAKLRSRRNRLEGNPSSLIEQQDGATAMLLGTGLWHARHLGQGALQQFQRSINGAIAEGLPPSCNTSQCYSPITAANGVQDHLLPYMMSTEYVFYYFAPLASFWFLVVYATLRIGRSHNHLWQFLTAKILVSAALVSAFLHTPGPLEAVFNIFRTTCRIHWSVYEVRFRFGLDQYIVFVGMLTAHRGVAVSNKSDYNLWHPFISFLPVLAYAILRNSHPVLAAYHSRAFAWLGRCSLETFTLQYHIWLAGDTEGLLSTGLFRGDGTFFGDRWRDFVLLTPVFLFVSWKMSNATTVITNLIVKDAEENASHGSLKSDEPELPEHNSKGAATKPSHSGERVYSVLRRLGRMLWPGNLHGRVLILLGIVWVCNWITPSAQRRP
ncbi:hypothetical protein H2199_007124 [Coniosporium tulheliwenetii]|uniref:Uncharacterized protein n=1 Tax=Coniosporium tulheliwenetii TaxID=3383036 RepID=A0ACC2YT31_9PEZI|nr:hypothetical protein H2199_007124 [Cladosporium sp. JES 115]